jgi:hypothetical protein
MSVKMRHALVACVAITALAAAVAPAGALANTAWVNNATPAKAPFSSCANPGFSSIQAAINSPNTSIRICKGTYQEQLQIERALGIVGEAGVTVKLPPVPANSTTPCDVAEAQDVVVVCVKGVVKISNTTFEGRWTEPPNCAKEFYGIVVGGEANLALTNSQILYAGADPINGCQQGVGLQVGHKRIGQVGAATLTNDTVAGYQKNGITVDGPGSKATIRKTTVKGAGPAPLAQNGIQVSRGAVTKVLASEITGNECAVASCGNGNFLELEEDATGVLFYLAGLGSSVSTSTINENDLGVSHISASETNQPQVMITSNTLVKDRYAGVMLGQGYAAVKKNTIEEGSVGILALQFAGQEFGPRGTGIEDKIHKMTKYAVEGLSDLNPSDQFGSVTMSKSEVSGNPGATPASSVFTNYPEKLKIFLGAGNT